MLRNERTSNITPESISRYAAAMCSTGYEGALVFLFFISKSGSGQHLLPSCTIT
jgi:hypothetical protein